MRSGRMPGQYDFAGIPSVPVNTILYPLQCFSDTLYVSRMSVSSRIIDTNTGNSDPPKCLYLFRSPMVLIAPCPSSAMYEDNDRRQTFSAIGRIYIDIQFIGYIPSGNLRLTAID